MGQEISQQQNQQQPHHQHHQQTPLHKLKSQRKSFSGSSSNNNNQPIYTPGSHLSTSSSSASASTNEYSTPSNSNNNNSNNNNNNQNYRLRHKYNLSKQTYERTKIAANTGGSNTSQSDTDSHYAKLNLQRSSSQSSDSGIYNSSCHCSSISSLSAVSSSASSCHSSVSSSSRGCPSSLLSSKSNKSLDKQKHYLSHHLYIKSYLDILEEDERARAHFKSARPGGIRNYTPKILASGEPSSAPQSSAPAPGVLSSSAPAHCYAAGKRTTAAGKHSPEDPWI